MENDMPTRVMNNKKTIMYATYPMAFHTPGGGEIQLNAYLSHINKERYSIKLFDQWEPNFKDHDLVHFFSCVGGSVHFCNFVKKLGIPVVVSSSLWITPETKEQYPTDEIKLQMSFADKIVTNSIMESEALSETLSIPIEKFYEVYNGVDPIFKEKQSPAIFRESYKITEPFVLCVGNIEPRKNQLKLAIAMRKFPNLKLILIGHIRDQEYLNEAIKSGLPQQVKYVGALNHDSKELRSAYEACDVFCLPSTLETPGLAAIEAVIQGCSLAVTKIGSTKEYFKDVVEYLDPNDPNSISEAIGKAMTVTDNKKHLLSQMGEDLLWPNVVKRLESLYDQF